MKKFKAILNRDLYSSTKLIKKGSICLINVYPKHNRCDVKEVETGKQINNCKNDCYEKI